MLPLSRSLTHPHSLPDYTRDSRLHQERELPTSEDNYRSVLVTTPPPFPDVEDLSDSESHDFEDNNETSITQPTKAFFLGPSCDTLLDDDPNTREKSKTHSLTPAINPLEYHGLDNSPLPPKKGSRFYRYVRWNFGSVYRRIFCLAFLGNVAALAFLITQSTIHGDNKTLTFQQAGTAVTANLLAAMLVRNEHIVNVLFWVFGTWSRRLPFWARKLVAKVYSYGGIHSGGAVAATFWYIAYLVLLTKDFQSGSAPLSVVRSYIYFVSYGILFMLLSMLIFAHPRLRVVMHNWFEGIHRFMGWTVVLLFWAQTMLLSADVSDIPLGQALLVSPTFWMLIAITLLVIYPWTRMRLRDVEAEVLSDHCVKLNFKYRDVHYGQAIRLTDAPLKETHAFGVVPFPAAPEQKNSTKPSRPDIKQAQTLSHAGEKGFSVFISNAGDWTRKIIQNPPTKIYTRGTPQFGVLRCAGLFERPVIVATGSGIAPCLSLFVQKPDHLRGIRVVWSAPSPLETYGQPVIDLILKTDPKAIIIDTRKMKLRPDLVKVAFRVWEEQTRGEGVGREKKGESAVVIISNQKVTKKVVYGLESRGVPAYGAIFDS
ncbi:hypothetical protein B0H66DRAFT_617976 [Apodospora peruviana]|uniref:Uncharacterized protein n=1 Tax=Apodospora peruviana TaxID=516989 RepID=A0AAE0IKB9_9PEZI|nr:hypothetical protein B0H66DRAFT_617976 [Apodospora peruviana]